MQASTPTPLFSFNVHLNKKPEPFYKVRVFLCQQLLQKRLQNLNILLELRVKIVPQFVVII